MGKRERAKQVNSEVRKVEKKENDKTYIVTSKRERKERKTD